MLGKIRKLRGKDQRDHACRVDAQGHMRALAAYHYQAVAAHGAHTLAVLHRDAPLPFLHDDDQRHRQHGHEHERQQFNEAALHGSPLDIRRHGRNDPAKDDDRDTVADAFLGDELTQPHGEHRAGRQRRR